MGTIRLFDYPTAPGIDGYFRCYTDHLNDITICMLSPDM